MFLKNTGTTSITGVEINGQTSMTIYAWEIVQFDDESGKTAFNENSSLEKVTYWSETKQTVVTMTTAELLAGFTTPKSLVVAPWAWKAIVVDKVIVTMDYVAAAYATNTTLEVRYTDGSWTKVTADIANMLTATADKIESVGWIEAELVMTANAAVVISVATWNPITWDSDIKVTTIYREVTI